MKIRATLLLIYRPRKDERLSWPSWLTSSGRFTHISGHPSAAGQVQDRESSSAKYRGFTSVLRNQPLATEGTACYRVAACQNLRDYFFYNFFGGVNPKHPRIILVMPQVPVSQILRRGGRYATSQLGLIVKSNVKQMCL